MIFFVNNCTGSANIRFLTDISFVSTELPWRHDMPRVTESRPTHKCPRALASAEACSVSARRCASFFVTHASQDFPEAVSFPVKLMALMSAYGMISGSDPLFGYR